MLVPPAVLAEMPRCGRGARIGERRSGETKRSSALMSLPGSLLWPRKPISCSRSPSFTSETIPPGGSAAAPVTEAAQNTAVAASARNLVINPSPVGGCRKLVRCSPFTGEGCAGFHLLHLRPWMAMSDLFNLDGDRACAADGQMPDPGKGRIDRIAARVMRHDDDGDGFRALAILGHPGA